MGRGMIDKKMVDPSLCSHPMFGLPYVDVKRVNSGEKTDFMLELRVACELCGTPFKFKGLKAGVDLDGATTDKTGELVQLAIEPAGRKVQ